MNSKIFMVLRIVFGLMLLILGLNKFFHFMDPPPGISADASAYFLTLFGQKVIYLVAVVEIGAGLSLLLNKYGALMSVILMSVSVNAVLFHAVLDPGNILSAIVLLLLNIIMLYNYKENYKGLLER